MSHGGMLFVVLAYFVARLHPVTSWVLSTPLPTRQPHPHTHPHPQSLWLFASSLLKLQQLGTYERLPFTEEDRIHRRVRLESFLIPQNNHSTITQNRRRRLIPFHEAWSWQRLYMEEHCTRLLMIIQQQQQQKSPDQTNTKRTGSFLSASVPAQAQGQALGIDRILFLEHEPVYTLGTASNPAYILNHNNNTNASSSVSVASLSSYISGCIPIVRMDRGGEVTYHGPGQLVVYPVLDLRNYRQDIHWYIRALEETVIVAMRQFGLTSAGRDGDCDGDGDANDMTTGVWIHNHKVAAMGIKCRKWITQHGMAINIEPQSVLGFQGIVPCGLEGRKVGCVSQFARRHVTVQEFAPYVKAAIEKVFCVQLIS